MLDAFASGFLVFGAVATALFHLSLALGAPLGEYVFGGQNPRPALRFRMLSLGSFAAAFAIAGHYLAQLGLLPRLLDDPLNTWANWVLVVLFLVSAVLSNLTASQKEKRLFGSVMAALFFASVLVAL